MTIDIMKNNYFQDILLQPKAIEDTYLYLRNNDQIIFRKKTLDVMKYRQIILTGMGSSFYALYPLYYRLMNAKIPVMMMETSELLYYGDALKEKETLFIVVSQSGKSAEVCHLFDQLSDDIEVIGITNVPDSVLAQRSTWVIPLQAGDEFSVSCKTYLATLVALVWLGDKFLSNDEAFFPGITGLIPVITTYLTDYKTHIDTFKKSFDGIKDLFIIGRGDSLANVFTGGLILKESAHFHAEGMSTAAFRHGPKEILAPSVMTMVLEGDAKTRALNIQMANEITEMGVPVILLNQNAEQVSYKIPKVLDRYLHIVEMLPIQMASIAISLLKDHDPGVFSIGSKITDVE